MCRVAVLPGSTHFLCELLVCCAVAVFGAAAASQATLCDCGRVCPPCGCLWTSVTSMWMYVGVCADVFSQNIGSGFGPSGNQFQFESRIETSNH